MANGHASSLDDLSISFGCCCDVNVVEMMMMLLDVVVVVVFLATHPSTVTQWNERWENDNL